MEKKAEEMEKFRQEVKNELSEKRRKKTREKRAERQGLEKEEAPVGERWNDPHRFGGGHGEPCDC